MSCATKPKALAMIARVVHDQEARTKILGSQTPAEVIGALRSMLEQLEEE